MVLCRTIRGAILHCISSTKMVLNSTNSGSLACKEPLKGLNRFFVRQWCYIAPQSCQRTGEEPLKNHWSTKIWCYTAPKVVPLWLRAKEPLLVLHSTIFFRVMNCSKSGIWWPPNNSNTFNMIFFKTYCHYCLNYSLIRIYGTFCKGNYEHVVCFR